MDWTSNIGINLETIIEERSVSCWQNCASGKKVAYTYMEVKDSAGDLVAYATGGSLF